MNYFNFCLFHKFLTPVQNFELGLFKFEIKFKVARILFSQSLGSDTTNTPKHAHV